VCGSVPGEAGDMLSGMVMGLLARNGSGKLA
jgi:NAD(P)H-hydrate repair Nnr-like enzyme with NAD(P)H-hydrate dehydratase domain